MSNGSGYDYTRVNFHGMETAVADFALAGQALERELSDLEGNLTKALPNWEGEANGQYKVFEVQWQSAANDIRNIIQQLSANVSVANENYMAAERANHGIWAQ